MTGEFKYAIVKISQGTERTTELDRRKGIKMKFTTFKSNRPLNIDELREILGVMEQQETNDRMVSTSVRLDGDHALIEFEADENGNITVL